MENIVISVHVQSYEFRLRTEYRGWRVVAVLPDNGLGRTADDVLVFLERQPLHLRPLAPLPPDRHHSQCSCDRCRPDLWKLRPAEGDATGTPR